jgi:hypothetical protein
METEDLIDTLMHLGEHIEFGDGSFNAIMFDAAHKIKELQYENQKLSGTLVQPDNIIEFVKQ